MPDFFCTQWPGILKQIKHGCSATVVAYLPMLDSPAGSFISSPRSTGLDMGSLHGIYEKKGVIGCVY